MSWLEFFELGSYVVTIIGLPFAILVYLLEQPGRNSCGVGVPRCWNA